MLFIQKINILIHWYYFLIVLFILSKYNSIDFQFHDELARKVKLITNSSNYLVCSIAFIYIIFNICIFRFDKYINIEIDIINRTFIFNFHIAKNEILAINCCIYTDYCWIESRELIKVIKVIKVHS